MELRSRDTLLEGQVETVVDESRGLPTVKFPVSLARRGLIRKARINFKTLVVFVSPAGAAELCFCD